VNRSSRLSKSPIGWREPLRPQPVNDRAPANCEWLARAGPVVITGGAGFIGANLARRLLAVGQKVILFDNLSRPGVVNNLKWLRIVYGDAFGVVIGDIRDLTNVEEVIRNAAAVFHFAAQVAVTNSLSRPREDFSVNAEGTLNLLEALRNYRSRIPLLFTSTNKVYGPMTNMQLWEEGLAYRPKDTTLSEHGINETAALDFHSPYGCSKGCAEQYVLDYSHTFGLPALVFRMSCIYGPLQCGNEDQGWVAHFASAMSRHQDITVYGSGKQVRDLLFVDDLIDAMFLAVCCIDRTAGRAFNIGGGPSNGRSVLEVISILSDLLGVKPTILLADWRKADQRYYISDTRAFRKVTGWQPRTTLRKGIERLCAWISAGVDRARSTPSRVGVAR
jgi:CDP-paratose 2-epimerase